MEMMEWRETAVGTFVAEAAEFTLRVRRTAGRQHVHFGVLKGREGLLASGTTTDIGAAMRAAQNIADRLCLTRKENEFPLLVLHDDPRMRATMGGILRGAGYAVIEAASSDDALSRLEKLSQPVLLIIERDPSGSMSGLEFAVAAQNLLPGTAILLTSEVGQSACCAPTEWGLAKPFRPDQLLERVAGAVTNMRTTTQSSAHRPA